MIDLKLCRFGDRLKMRNGEMAIYVGSPRFSMLHFLVAYDAIEAYCMLYADDTGKIIHFTSRDYDIVGIWKRGGNL